MLLRCARFCATPTVELAQSLANHSPITRGEGLNGGGYISAMKSPVYLDHAATTPVRAEVMEAMLPYLGEHFGNPSSAHRWGRRARTALDEARERVAHCLGAHADELCFTSGGTEGDNMAVLGAWRAVSGAGRNTIVTTPIEHKAVIEAVHAASRGGAAEHLLDVPQGQVSADARDVLRADGVALASIMWVNNEIGVVQDVPLLAAATKEGGALFHTDAVQAFGKVPIDAAATPFDLLTISGHKIGAPKGVGALFIRRGTPMSGLLFGGSQNRGRRPGTENVAFAVGLAVAAELAVAERETECARLAALRDRLESELLRFIPDVVVHGREVARAPHISNISIPGTDSESLLMALDLAGIACSAGSACQTGASEASYVLTAIGAAPELASAAIRMSFGSLNDASSVERVAEVLPKLVARSRGAAQAALRP
jgi:cysteine desulfurase